MALSGAFGYDAPITTSLSEGEVSAHFIPGHVDIEVIHLDFENLSASQDFMLIDLSDTTNWPHTTTGHIDIAHILINIAPSTSFAGDLEIGFLTNVDATNGDFNGVIELHMDQKVDPFTFAQNYGAFEMSMETAHFFGPVDANDTAFQTDVSITGPDGNTFPSGNGDLVLRITRTAGNVSGSITLGYRTHS